MDFKVEGKEKIVCVSGGMTILHSGHIRLLKEAKKLGDKLLVILNNDNWVLKKYGKIVKDEATRKEILESISYVDKVILTNHKANDKDRSVCHELANNKIDIFANGGDRVKGNIPEYDVCERLGIEMKFNVGGGKIDSSSSILSKQETDSTLLAKNPYVRLSFNNGYLFDVPLVKVAELLVNETETDINKKRTKVAKIMIEGIKDNYDDLIDWMGDNLEWSDLERYSEWIKNDLNCFDYNGNFIDCGKGLVIR